ncbi:hypothetical protein B296_00008077 [Ensete ventricosum]|uniref:Uncharacterized protein n=1 Tax=Ensete ventricosum TaxID=4639 RepID=A0A426Y491_ENSVE|nr:hypothetical protein B296_00008077 [Ensete ventricosum]
MAKENIVAFGGNRRGSDGREESGGEGKRQRQRDREGRLPDHLGIEPGLDDAVRLRREFARRFVEGIGKLVKSTSGDHRKKTKRLTARMSEVTGLTEVRSYFKLVVFKRCNC